MLSAASLVAGGPFERWYLDAGPEPEKVVYQLAGSDGETLARAATLVSRLPGVGVDINMGCSAPVILRKREGAAWMRPPEHNGHSFDDTARMVGLVRKAVGDKRLSVKLRLGESADYQWLLDFCRRLVNAGVDLITLHPRTIDEKFKRRARWDYCRRLALDLPIPVAGNGDIDSASELADKAAETRPDGSPLFAAVMAGRLAVREPWCFAQAKALKSEPLPSSSSPLTFYPLPFTSIEETGLRFLGLLEKYQPPEFHLSRARRFFTYFCKHVFWGEYLKNKVCNAPDLDGMRRQWTAYFASEATSPETFR
jgi:tRNA-dihydrouridine synthase